MDYENDYMDSRYIQSRQNKLILEYDEESNNFNVLNSEGNVIGMVDESVHEPSEAYSSIQEMIKNKDVHFSNSYDERERVIEYLSRLKKMNQQQLEEEKKNVINELFDLGDDLNGNNLSYRDLQLALITGRDLDGIDIPNDTPEERQAEEHTEKMIKEDKYTREVDWWEKRTLQI